MENLIPTKTIKENGVDAIKNGIKPNPNKLIPIERKPTWLRVKSQNSSKYRELKSIVSEKKLHTVCEEAMCPNIQECWSHGTATFMLLGSVCTRACRFCAVDTGNPKGSLDKDEPIKVASSIAHMNLKYAVLTSVNRDDLRDGGASHFKDCIDNIRKKTPLVKIEILTPDFRGRVEKALNIFDDCAPDVFNHNLETVPSLYPKVRPGSDYEQSLDLLKSFEERHPHVKTKSGLMLGVGENQTQVINVLKDLRKHKVDMLTLGQYLQPSRHHLAVEEYITPEQFDEYKMIANDLGFSQVASGPMVRSSYHADLQVKGELVN